MKILKLDKVTLFLLVALGLPQMSLGQDSFELDDDILYSDQLDVDGQFQKPSAADNIKKRRRSLENRNENLVRKKIENARIREERKLSKKLKGLLSGNPQALEDDSVQVTASASQKNVLIQETPVVHKKYNRVSVTPFFGIKRLYIDDLSVNGVNLDDNYDSDISTGLNVDFNINPRFSVGLGFNYTKVEIEDVPTFATGLGYSNSTFNNPFVVANPFVNSFNNFNNGFQNFTTNLDYEQLSFEVNSKFYILTKKIRPYLGLGFGINRSKLEFDQDNSTDFTGVNTSQFTSNAEYDNTYASASISGGSQFLFTKNFGANLELKYFKGFAGDSDNFNSFPFDNSGGQVFLENLGNELDDSSSFSINAGAAFSF